MVVAAPTYRYKFRSVDVDKCCFDVVAVQDFDTLPGTVLYMIFPNMRSSAVRTVLLPLVVIDDAVRQQPHVVASSEGLC